MRFLTCLLGVFSLTSVAQAQFPGDVFFEPNSVAVAAGEEFDVDVRFFAGASLFGAADVELFLPGLDLELVSAVGVHPGYDEGLYWTRAGDELRLSVVKDALEDGAIGSVTLARLTFRAVGTPGTLVGISSRVNDGLDLDANRFNSSNGTGVNVSITSASTAPLLRGLAKSRFLDLESPYVFDDWLLTPLPVSPSPLGGTGTLYFEDPRSGRVVRKAFQTRDWASPLSD